jgi:hypothetical protein
VFSLPKIPWQVTGNHWISVPCIHPVDGAIHALGVVQRRWRGAVEFAGGPTFLDGDAAPLMKVRFSINGTPHDLSTVPMAWQRISEWLPAFNAQVNTAGTSVVVRGTIFAPCGKHGQSMPGIVYAVSFENRGTTDVTIAFTPHGTLGWRQHRVTSSKPFVDDHVSSVAGNRLILSGAAPDSGAALAIALDGGAFEPVARQDRALTWTAHQEFVIPAGERKETAIYLAVAPQDDGAAAMVGSMVRRGWRTLAEQTRAALSTLEQSTGVAAADRLVNRHLMFAYFFGIARALDDGQLYLMRTRAPWNDHGMTLREWDALMWTIPAIQLADSGLARELIVRMCEIHGYAPGASVNYLDGMPFRAEFSLDGAASYALAVDRYIAQTGDDRIVEEPAIADTLYAAYEDIGTRRDGSVPLYSTEVTPSGATTLPFTLHANAVVAHALDIFRQTLDEKTAEKVELGDIVRAALPRYFSVSEGDVTRATLAAATDLAGQQSMHDDAVGSVYWLPLYDAMSRTDSVYRRTVKRLSIDPDALALTCATLIGPDANAVLDRLRRLPLDNGVAAERIDEQGIAVGNGGDAALSGLLAYAVWYSVNALGNRI